MPGRAGRLDGTTASDRARVDWDCRWNYQSGGIIGKCLMGNQLAHTKKELSHAWNNGTPGFGWASGVANTSNVSRFVARGARITFTSRRVTAALSKVNSIIGPSCHSGIRVLGKKTPGAVIGYFLGDGQGTRERGWYQPAMGPRRKTGKFVCMYLVTGAVCERVACVRVHIP